MENRISIPKYRLTKTKAKQTGWQRGWRTPDLWSARKLCPVPQWLCSSIFSGEEMLFLPSASEPRGEHAANQRMDAGDVHRGRLLLLPLKEGLALGAGREKWISGNQIWASSGSSSLKQGQGVLLLRAPRCYLPAFKYCEEGPGLGEGLSREVGWVIQECGAGEWALPGPQRPPCLLQLPDEGQDSSAGGGLCYTTAVPVEHPVKQSVGDEALSSAGISFILSSGSHGGGGDWGGKACAHVTPH